jgi:hypothetical protein
MSEQHFNALPAGYQLQEYTVKSVLGHGGFGITYLAGDNNLGKDVAIKEYLPTEFAVRRDDSRVQPRSTADNDDYEWGLDRFMKEGQTLGLFRHPNIVPVFRAFKENGTAYMVMEYQKGQPLTELFRKHRSDFTEEDLLGVTIPLLDGLAVVHKAGYLHRDLKPGNIFIREDGSPVLLDFGAARNAVGRKSKNLTSIVTPGYAPLEQYFADGNQGPWTDIYAMASILYQAVAGRIPPEAPARVKRDPITPAIDAGRGRFSEAFLNAIDAGLRVEEEQRPQTVEQWRAMLLDQEVPEAPPAPASARMIAPASVRSSATMLAGPAGHARGENQTIGGSASMRFPTIAREDATAHTQRRGMSGGKIAAIAAGVVVLLAASGVGAYIALNPDHGLFGPTADADKRNADATKVSAEAERERQQEEARRKAEDDKRKQESEQEAKRRKDQEDAKRRDDEAKRAEEAKREEQRKEKEEAARRERERKAEEDARKRKEQEEARRRDEDEARRKKEQEDTRRPEDDDVRKREAERRREEEEARRRDDDVKRREQEEARRREEEERKPKTVSCDNSVLKNVYPHEVDCFFVGKTFAVALETARENSQATVWRNPRTGSSGTFRILGNVTQSDGNVCRRFEQTLTVRGQTYRGNGLACYRNNTWQIVSS